MKNRPVVRLCGLGAQPPEETTLEVLRLLEDSRVVFTDVEDKALLKWLKPYCKKLIALGKETTAKQAARVLAEAGKTEGKGRGKGQSPVAVAVWGHPLLSSRLGAELAKRGGRGVELQVPGAISPAGSAFAKAGEFFGGTYGHPGLQLFEAATALEEKAALETELPLVLFGGPRSEPVWAEAFAWIAKTYPKDHPVREFPSQDHLVVYLPPIK